MLVDSSLKGAPYCLHSTADNPILGQHKRFQDTAWAAGSLPFRLVPQLTDSASGARAGCKLGIFFLSFLL